MNTLYAAALPFIEERETQVVFGNTPKDATWAEHEEDPARPMAGAEVVIDKRFWLLLGKPDQLVFGFAKEEGWEKWVGSAPPAVSPTWMRPVEAS